jgi:hypothetical protein
MSAGNKRTLLLFLVVSAVLSLVPISSHAAIFWDDEMESGGTGFTFNLNQPCGGANAFTFDTTQKVSGNGSVRLDYSGANNCGGFADRSYAQTDDLYSRVYIRFSPNWVTSPVVTKFTRSDTNGPNSNWWTMLWGGTTLSVGAQNVPVLGSTVNYYSNFTFSKGVWYCVETREYLGTAGTANGIIEAWVNGNKVMGVTGVQFRQSGDNSLYVNKRMYRQEGTGSIWYDRMAVGNSRIGCIGSVPASDSTPPAPPVGLLVR